MIAFTGYSCSPSEVLLGKKVLKLCTKCTGEHPYRRVISIKLQSNFTEITPRHACPSVNLLHIFRTSFPKNASGGLPLKIINNWYRTVGKQRLISRNGLPLFCLLHSMLLLYIKTLIRIPLFLQYQKHISSIAWVSLLFQANPV